MRIVRVGVAALLTACGDDEGCDTSSETLDFEAVHSLGDDDLGGSDGVLSDAECFEACVPTDVHVDHEVSCEATFLDRTASGQLALLVECQVEGYHLCG